MKDDDTESAAEGTRVDDEWPLSEDGVPIPPLEVRWSQVGGRLQQAEARIAGLEGKVALLEIRLGKEVQT